MMAKLLTRIAVGDEAEPVLDALHAMGHDIGSVSATSIGCLDLPEAARFLCVALSSPDEVPRFGDHLRYELLQQRPLAEARMALRLTDRVMVWPLPCDAVLVVFLDVAAAEVPL